jgi:hypothetical protein
MHIIDLTPLEKGVYNDHKADHITAPPEGWAMIPEDMELPSTFPRLGSIEAEEITHQYEVENEDGEKEQRERTILTVTKMTEGTVPEPVEPEPTEMEVLQDEVTALQLALCDQYEENLALQEEVTNTQLALVELYEGSVE